MATINFPPTKYVLLSSPAPRILLVTMNLAKQMNSLPVAACWEMNGIWDWFDAEPELWVAIITGTGRGFSTGMDIKERASLQKTHTEEEITRLLVYPPTGFGGFTSRVGKKPVIAAVNGHAHGGGFEIALNSDIVIASTAATFRLPDVSRGTAAMLGAFPRLLYHVGLQRAMLMALTAYTLGPEEAKEWGIVLKVVPEARLLEEALEIAKAIASMSPDSIIASRSGVRLALEMAGVERAVQLNRDMFGKRLMEGENVREGLRAFLEKREAKWVPSKL